MESFIQLKANYTIILMFILAGFQMHVAVNAALYNCEGKQKVDILLSGLCKTSNHLKVIILIDQMSPGLI